ncbi:hypothetical protein BABINDRAFT_159544 [Babjeviella inositovora NRRL Y-12698]|uniref:SDE2-like domain-containing protein n=1 Tax=Babjeviella inositovora NRRL Y-12698 TaxID=984486 RepID=A0A1E3QZH9_9ASCO|nr:uncharacterized protein BABINDRAFT_159544 [Babjeviella inositovora NRRL Y-12698]ODQ83083.1 hypothetical protein BABINDRAFT_159544 [Babjeviella inositovora NRRL Y-12698]
MKYQIFIKTISGIENLSLSVLPHTPTLFVQQEVEKRLPAAVVPKSCVCTADGLPVTRFPSINEMMSDCDFINLHVRVKVCGGKGGFGALLRAQGKANLKTQSKDYYKTLDGRVMKTVKRAERLQKVIDALPELERTKLTDKKEKLKKVIESIENRGKADRFDDAKYLELIEASVNEIKVIIEADSETEDSDDWGSDWESSDQEEGCSKTQEPEKKAKPVFESFFQDM